MLRLRPATIADLALLRHWDEQPHAVSEEAGALFAHVADLYGNEIVLVQLPA